MMKYFELKNEKIRDVKKEVSNSIQEYLNTMLLLGYEIRAQNSASFSYIPESLQPIFEAPDSKASRKRKRDFFTCKDDAPVDFYWNLIKEFNSSPAAYITEILDFWQTKTQLSSKISQTKFKAINQVFTHPLFNFNFLPFLFPLLASLISLLCSTSPFLSLPP